MQVWCRVLFVCLGLFCLTACSDRSFTPVMPSALKIGAPYTVFAVTTRAQSADGSFGIDRSEDLKRLELTISVPPGRKQGDLQNAYGKPNPNTQFTMAARNDLSTKADFRNRIDQVMTALPGNQRDVTVFIHGYNTTQSETVFRAAQLGIDTKLPGVAMVYSWPSQGKSLGYAYDIDSALFARDGLEQLLFELKTTKARRVVLVAHSMGALVLMETLRQIELHRPGWVGQNISGVLLISPDLDIDLFRAQMKSLLQIPQPFVVFVSGKDLILGLSARLRGGKHRERLGSLSGIDAVADLPIEILDTTAFSENAQSSHFVAGSSPALLALIGKARSVDRSFGPETQGLGILVPGKLVRKNQATRLTLLPSEIGR